MLGDVSGMVVRARDLEERGSELCASGLPVGPFAQPATEQSLQAEESTHA